MLRNLQGSAPPWPAPRPLRRHGAGSMAGHHRGAALCLRGAGSVAERRRGAANEHVRRRGAILRAERHRGAAQTALCRRGASSVTWHHRGAIDVHMRRRGAIFRAERHRGAAQTVFVRQPGHGVSSRPIHGHHGEVCTWRSANPRDTPCRGDHRRYSHVPSANVAVSLGHHRGAIFSVCRLSARIVGLVVWARPLQPGVVRDLHGGAPPWCYGCDARPALTEPGGTQATRDRVA